MKKRILNIRTFIAVILLLLFTTGCTNNQAQQEEATTKVEVTNNDEAATNADADENAEETIAPEISSDGWDDADIPETPSPDNLAAAYAPEANFALSYEIMQDDGQTKTVKYNTVRLENMPAGYLSTIYKVDDPSEFIHYFSDTDGLRIIEDMNFDDRKLVLPSTLEEGFVWDNYQLMRVEEDPEYSLGSNIDTAFLLFYGEDSDELRVYSMGMGLVGRWENAGDEAPALSKLTEMIKIDEETAQSGFKAS